MFKCLSHTSDSFWCVKASMVALRSKLNRKQWKKSQKPTALRTAAVLLSCGFYVCCRDSPERNTVISIHQVAGAMGGPKQEAPPILLSCTESLGWLAQCGFGSKPTSAQKGQEKREEEVWAVWGRSGDRCVWELQRGSRMESGAENSGCVRRKGLGFPSGDIISQSLSKAGNMKGQWKRASQSSKRVMPGCPHLSKQLSLTNDVCFSLPPLILSLACDRQSKIEN